MDFLMEKMESAGSKVPQIIRKSKNFFVIFCEIVKFH